MEKVKKDYLILGIETSCDETSVAVVKNGRTVLSNIISTQIDIHKRYGGVVPEVASRNHIMAIDSVLKEALEEAKISLDEIDAIAVTYGAGLVGALMVGVTFAKTLAYSLNKPLIAVSHIEGHIASNYINTTLKPPFTALVVSGGHTEILEVSDFNKFKIIGSTLDDAIGEAFDKVARVLGLDYPGGPEIDRLSLEGKPTINFGFKSGIKKGLDVSFSGLKTAVINYINTMQQKNEQINKADIASSFQKIAVDLICDKAILVAKRSKNKTLVVAGGVSANKGIRAKLETESKINNIKFYMPSLKLCTDNAGMIASQGYFNLINGKGLADLTLSASSKLNRY